jgi:hypothetical protein
LHPCFRPGKRRYHLHQACTSGTGNPATMSYSSGFQTPGSWTWPDDLPKSEPAQAEPSTSSSSSSSQQPPNTSDSRDTRTGSGARSKRTHWPPRQCRICLETVQPTFNAASESLPGFLQSPNVVYEDDGGRLIRPCMCKGSSKYVHDACLQAWRHADPGYARRNYWQCPTCGFKYRLARLGVGRFIGSIGKFYGFSQHTCHVQKLTRCSCSSYAHSHHSFDHCLHPWIYSRSNHWFICRSLELLNLEPLGKIKLPLLL